MNSFVTTELKTPSYFSDEVFLDKTFLLLPKSLPVTEPLLSALRDWEFKEIFSKGTCSETLVQDTAGNVASKQPVETLSFEQKKNIALEIETVDLKDLGVELDPVPSVAATTQSVVNSSRIVAGSGSAANMGDVPEANNVRQQVQTGEYAGSASKRPIPIKTADNVFLDNESRRIDAVRNSYAEYLEYINTVYIHYATHKTLDLDNISEKVKELCIFIKDNRRYVLRIEQEMYDTDYNFLIKHSMRTTVLAVIIALQLRMPLTKIIELGVACVLHEIGMIRLPPQLYLSNRVLSSAEKNQLCTHPIISYTILKGFDAPLSICLGVLEHHEKENGRGYPRHLSGSKISLYAKIISVVCSFEAITAPRTYKTASGSFEAMVELLKNTGQQYDGTVIKALLYSLSLFPVGSYVYLSDGRIGRVVDVHPENPKNPVVEIIGATATGEDSTVIETNNSDLSIVRALTKNEVESVIKATKV